MEYLCRLGVLLILLATGLSAQAATAGASPRKPNVLFVVVDDLNTALGSYGDRLARTPNIDRLAARGVRFDRAYCQYPLCNPSRVSFLSGRRPEATGVYVLNIPARTALPEAVLLPQFFRQNGYYTAGAGKIFHSVRVSDAASWDRYEDGDGGDEQEKAAIKSRYGGGDGRPAWHVLDSEGENTRDGLNTRTIRGLIAERAGAGQPFFLAMGFHKPHLPWTAPRRFFDQHREADFAVAREKPMQRIPAIALQTELSGFAQPDSVAGARRAYYACVSFIDHQLGVLLDELDRRDLTRSTIIVFFSDHGFHLGDHGGLWAKLSAFDASTRVPLIIAGPGIPVNRSVDAPVELIDVYPTLAALAGLSAPASLDGRSLVSSWERAPAAERPARSLVFHYDATELKDVQGSTVITRDWRYTEWEGGASGRELYLRADDPGELNNRAGDPAQSALVKAGEALQRELPAPKPGRAERPRALVKSGKSK
jgi:iduronate 2-sulfatase